jgi:predicted AlkP superfamily phosphohydrolase/phosphomutase
VYLGSDIFKGDRADEAPDLVVGFERGYRVSWQASLGNVERVDGLDPTADPAAGILSDNPFRWSGDHCSVDPELVKGIWFSAMPIDRDREPRVEDVAPTVLGLFGLKSPATDGRDVRTRD